MGLIQRFPGAVLLFHDIFLEEEEAVEDEEEEGQLGRKSVRLVDNGVTFCIQYLSYSCYCEW